MNISEDAKNRETFPKIFEYLNIALSDPKIVKDCLKNNIDLVVTEMLLRISDPMEGRYSKYSRYFARFQYMKIIRGPVVDRKVEHCPLLCCVYHNHHKSTSRSLAVNYLL